MKRAFQSGLFLVCVLASVAGMYNVMSDNAEVEKLAEQTACGNEGTTCRAQKTMMERNPIAQTFTFVVGKGKNVGVRCTRAFVLAGDYACALR